MSMMFPLTEVAVLRHASAKVSLQDEKGEEQVASSRRNGEVYKPSVQQMQRLKR